MFSLADVSNEVFLRIDQEESGIPKLKKNGVLDISRAVFDVIAQAMAAGEQVAIPQFGKFYPHPQPARNARNPRTGKKIKVKAKTVPRFRASSSLREKVISANPKK